MLYWFQAHGRVVAREWEGEILPDLRFDPLESQRRRDGAPDDPDARRRVPEAAQARMMKLGPQLASA